MAPAKWHGAAKIPPFSAPIFRTELDPFARKTRHMALSFSAAPVRSMSPSLDTPRTIVLVDDDRNILTSVTVLLEAEGFKVRA